MNCRIESPRWSDEVEWWRNPALAYARGVQDGIELGRSEADRRLIEIVAEVLGAEQLRDGIRDLLRHHDQVAVRDAAYATAGHPRPNDYPGRTP